MRLKHKQLVNLAKLWLIQAKGCNPVFTEKGSAQNNEFPDAVGWASEDCIIVECKTSITDFNADKKKDFRINNQGMGKYRYYLIPREIFCQAKEMLPDGWGLVVADYEHSMPHQERLKGSGEFKSNIESERNFLRSRILEIQRFGR